MLDLTFQISLLFLGLRRLCLSFQGKGTYMRKRIHCLAQKGANDFICSRQSFFLPLAKTKKQGLDHFQASMHAIQTQENQAKSNVPETMVQLNIYISH